MEGKTVSAIGHFPANSTPVNRPGILAAEVHRAECDHGEPADSPIARHAATDRTFELRNRSAQDNVTDRYRPGIPRSTGRSGRRTRIWQCGTGCVRQNDDRRRCQRNSLGSNRNGDGRRCNSFSRQELAENTLVFVVMVLMAAAVMRVTVIAFVMMVVRTIAAVRCVHRCPAFNGTHRDERWR